MCIIKTPELSSLLAGGNITLSPITLYVDDRAILASGPTLEMTAQLATLAFEEMHNWLSQRGLKTDQVKNELMHFTKSKNCNNNPPIHIPSNIPGEQKEVTPSRCMRYLRLWFNPQLKFHEHIKIAASKASIATKALRMLGNSTRGLNHLYLRQMYLGAILLIATYGSMAFWDGRSNFIRNTLECTQNKVL